MTYFPRRGKKMALKTLRNIDADKHGNSYLHYALVWNDVSAAIDLAMLTVLKDPFALSCCDRFCSSHSTSLVLAAKTGNSIVAIKILSAINVLDFVDIPDHLGNTALHYACLMRNVPLIEALLDADAAVDCKNGYGFTPLDYYQHETIHFENGSHSLSYRYGTHERNKAYMQPVEDWSSDYMGTADPLFSCYRWFLVNIVLNLQLLHQDEIWQYPNCFLYDGDHASRRINVNRCSVISLLRYHLQERIPVMDIRLYNLLAQRFVEYRQKCCCEESMLNLLVSTENPTCIA